MCPRINFEGGLSGLLKSQNTFLSALSKTILDQVKHSMLELCFGLPPIPQYHSESRLAAHLLIFHISSQSSNSWRSSLRSKRAVDSWPVFSSRDFLPSARAGPVSIGSFLKLPNPLKRSTRPAARLDFLNPSIIEAQHTATSNQTSHRWNISIS